MPTPQIIPPWMHGPADPGSTYLQGYHSAAAIALQNQEMAQRMRIADMASSMRRDEFNSNQELQEQEMAQRKAYQDAQLGLASDAAAKKYQAMQEYQQAVQGGMDPVDAILLIGPRMNVPAGTLSEAMRAKENRSNNVPPTMQTVTMPGGVDYSDYEASGTPIESYYDDQTAGIIPQPKTVSYMQRGNHPVQFVPQSAISSGDGEDLPVVEEGPDGSKLIYRRKGGGIHVQRPQQEGRITGDTALRAYANLSELPKEIQDQLRPGLSNLVNQALSPRAKKTASPVERALAGTNAMPLPTLPTGKVDSRKLKVGTPYVTKQGTLYFTGVKGHEFTDTPPTSMTGQPTSPAGMAPTSDELLPGEEE